MAAAAASAAAISSLSLRRRHLPSQPSIFFVSFNLTPPTTLPLFRARPTSVSTLLSSKIKASDGDEDDFETSFSDDVDDDDVDTSLSEDDDDDDEDVDASLSDGVDTSLSDDVDTTVSDELETSFSDEVDPDSDIVFDPSEDYDPTDDLDEIPTESEEEIAAAYEELYGPAFSGISVLGNDIYAEDANRKDEIALGPVTTEGRTSDGFEERLVQVRRVTKVVKGGKQLQFRAIVIIGDKQGHVGVGVAKGREVTIAVEKSARDARRNIITVPMTKYLTFPHRSEGRYGAAKVMLRPAAPGTGVIAGGSVRVVLELAGVENALGKQLGSGNALNNARATIDAILQMRQFSEVALERGIPMEELWK